jgi:diguanylate cyclase (GGDEF)-like protein/PAS domain S-box-containing protein
LNNFFVFGQSMSETSSYSLKSSASAVLRAFNQVYASARYDVHGKIIAANPQFLRLLGYDLDELVGQADFLFFSQSFQRNLQNELWEQLRAGAMREQVALWVNKSGHELWLKSRYVPIIDGEGTTFEVVQIVEDVTDQQEREADDRAQIKAINRTQAVAQFGLDGMLLSANEVFFTTFGYQPVAIQGKSHDLFVSAEEAKSHEYKEFWERLCRGQSQTGEFRRCSADGRDIWLQGVYSPVLDPAGRSVKIVLYAHDITQQKLRQVDYEWQINAIHKSNIAVTFDNYGTILDANEVFLKATGFALDEIVGNHHRIFIESTHAHGSNYATFWSDLKKGKHRAGTYRRKRKDGSPIWLQATYNPIFDASGNVMKVVKYASEVTAERLMQADHQGQIAAINAVQCVASFDLDGNVIDANENFLAATGYKFADVRGRHHCIFVDEQMAQSVEYRSFWEGFKQGEIRSGEFKRFCKDGSEIWLQATYTPILDMNGKPFKVVKYATNVTAEKLAEADYRGQIDAINKLQGVAVFKLDGTITGANDNFLNVFGYEREDLLGQHHSSLVERDHYTSQSYIDFWRNLRAGEGQGGMFKRLGKDGKVIWVQASYNPILDLNGVPSKVILYATDVSENVALANAFEDAQRQNHHDAATSLPNRVKLSNFMSNCLAGAEAKMAVFYIDLDRFKPINDNLGHHVGDRVLGEVADRMRRVLSEDQLVARVGGDEFVIAAPGMTSDDVELFCRRLYEVVEPPIVFDGKALSVGMSIGVAIAPYDGKTPDDLLRASDTALSKSKDNGRGQYSFFAKDMNDYLLAQRQLTNDMRHSLTAGDFYLEYQPRFDTRSRKIRSAEALVRWSHPERGRIAPIDFIPLAETNGLIIPLGDWILRTACKEAAAWGGIGVSVNVSPVQFRGGDLVDKVKSALAEFGLEPHHLELEITEGVLLEDEDHAVELLKSLKEIGVTLAMDDFGTGYSSLSYLRKFPFDVIKIDRSFITDLELSGSARSIVQAILALGKALGLSVTAEGVETNEQLAILTADQCNEVQGYLLARPLRYEQMLDVLEEMPELREKGNQPEFALA